MAKIEFDNAPKELVQICESDAAFLQYIDKACWIRNLRGCLQLVVEPSKLAPTSAELKKILEGLGTSLHQILEDYFVGPVLATTEAQERGSIAKAILAQGQPAAEFELVTPLGVGRPQKKWFFLERRLAKHQWLEQMPGKAIWKRTAQTPLVATFYSFKGGVGRTTALAACALHAARAGKKVVAIDLDLEAPGLGTLLEIEKTQLGGVLDAIVEHLATGTLDLAGRHMPAKKLNQDQREAGSRESRGEIVVFPAGNLEQKFIEKLARLDFLGSTSRPGSDSPVQAALKALLAKIRKELKPDLILIDARAGLHDLAGLSLHGLAHIDILLSRASEQAYAGLKLTIETLGGRSTSECQPLVVHNFAPADPFSPEYLRETAEFRSRVYSHFTEHYYGDDAPGEESDGPHSPIVLPYEERLVRFTLLASIEKLLFSEGFGKLWDRLWAMGAPA